MAKSATRKKHNTSVTEVGDAGVRGRRPGGGGKKAPPLVLTATAAGLVHEAEQAGDDFLAFELLNAALRKLPDTELGKLPDAIRSARRFANREPFVGLAKAFENALRITEPQPADAAQPQHVA